MIRLNKALAAACTGILIAGAGQGAAASGAQSKAYTTTVSYMTEFYPLWFTHQQAQSIPPNRLVGPNKITPLYQTVVAINVDTLYASTFVDLSKEPVILTLPRTEVTYSILPLDPYGDVLPIGITPGQPGTYALIRRNYTGKLPKDVTAVPMPLDHFVLIFRSDQYSSDSSGNKDQTKASEIFRKTLQLQTWTDWRQDPHRGYTAVLPEAAFARPNKTIADTLAANDPLKFLTQLQAAVAGSNTPPFSPEQRKLSDGFNALFAHSSDKSDFARGTQDAHKLILDDYLDHTGANNWIHFTNMGAWTADQQLDRSAITEFIQYGNNISAAAYYQTFKDGSGAALDGTDPKGYVLNIPADQIPQAKRFWSFTAYTPESVELIKNDANVYHVASYTPGLAKNADHSITLYIARVKPKDAPAANWLPVGKGTFNIMLRVYGPQGRVADNSYTPPPIEKAK